MLIPSQTSGLRVYALGGLGKNVNKMGSNAMDRCGIYTLNCEGFVRNSDFIKDLLSNHNPDILCMQETWLLKENCCKINYLHDGYLSISKSGADSSDAILTGRPKGGASIMYTKRLSRAITQVTIDSNRVCALRIQGVDTTYIIVICIYMPCDYMLMNECNREYEDIINQDGVCCRRYIGVNVTITTNTLNRCTICSLNCEGFNRNSDYLNDVLIMMF